MNDAEFRRRAHALLMRLGHVGGCVECGKPPFGFRGHAIPNPAAEVDELRKAGPSPDPVLARTSWECGCWMDVKARSLCAKHTGPGEAAFMVAMRGCGFRTEGAGVRTTPTRAEAAKSIYEQGLAGNSMPAASSVPPCPRCGGRGRWPSCAVCGATPPVVQEPIAVVPLDAHCRCCLCGGNNPGPHEGECCIRRLSIRGLRLGVIAPACADQVIDAPPVGGISAASPAEPTPKPSSDTGRAGGALLGPVQTPSEEDTMDGAQA